MIIDRYLDGDLTDAELARFEERLTWDQDLLKEVEFAEFQIRELRKSVAEDDNADSGNVTSMLDRFTSVLVVPQFAAAASFVLATVLTSAFLLGPLAPQGGSETVNYSTTDIVPLYATRSGDSRVVTVDRNGWTVLLVDAPVGYDEFRVILTRAESDTSPAWIKDNLRADFQDSLAVGIAGDVIGEGSYVLTVEGVVVTDDGTRTYSHIQDISFQSTVRP